MVGHIALMVVALSNVVIALLNRRAIRQVKRAVNGKGEGRDE